MSWTRFAEGEGSGIVTAIEECKELSAPMPTVEDTRGSVKVTIFPRSDWRRLESRPTAVSSNSTLQLTLSSLHQLPTPPRDFTGREAELDNFRSYHDKGRAVTIFSLQGMGGVGKTSLALKLSEEVKPFYPDAQIYLDLKGVDPHPLTATQAMAHVIHAFHPSARLPESEDELAGLYRSILDGKRALLLMDN